MLVNGNSRRTGIGNIQQDKGVFIRFAAPASGIPDQTLCQVWQAPLKYAGREVDFAANSINNRINSMKPLFKFCKDFLLFFPLTFLFRPFSRLFLFLSYFNKLLEWIYRNRKSFEMNDYYSPVRDYTKRYRLYAFMAEKKIGTETPVLYLEFGVAAGASFEWWLAHNTNPSSAFFGFDTFEGLPEKWGSFYGKGDMKFTMPGLNDARGLFVKGLFQDTLPGFLAEQKELLTSERRKVILLDADLYSATIFTLSQLYPFLRSGDVIMFDEFNVAMHEFKAYTEFVGNFYVKLKPVAAVNNYYQVAFMVE